MATAIANRYAQALTDLVLEEPGLEPSGVAGQLRGMEDTLATSAELRNVLANPAVSAQQKRALVARLGQMLAISPLVRNFFFVLIDRRRIAHLREIRERFEELIDERLGLVRAKVTSAREMSSEQRERLRRELSSLAGKQVRSEHVLDDALLGGAVVQLGSTVYDGSVRGRLETLRRKLME